jgi:VanZ family protein
MPRLLPLDPIARTRRYRWLALLFLLAVLVVLSLPGALLAHLADMVKALLLLPPSDEQPSLLPLDKLVHAGLFFVAGVLLGRGWHGRASVWVLLGLALLAFGGLTEGIQSFVPGRSASWGDVLADALGAAAGLLLARIIGVRGTYA